MADQIAIWRDEHVRFARLLDLLDRQLAEFHAASRRPDYELMRDIVHYMRDFADRFHHPREDVAFARLVERDPAMQLTVNRLLQEHRVIALAGDELLGHLEAIVADVLVKRETVERAAATYLVYYRHHLGTEESAVLPSAARLLTQHDWAAVAAAVPAGSDPLFADEFDARFQDLRRQLVS